MKASELKNKNASDLLKLVHDKKEELRVVRSNTSGGKSKNVKEIKGLRKDVARMLTALNAEKTK